jgi:hypothetical protein
VSDRLDRALELLAEAQLRISYGPNSQKVWQLLDVAIGKIRDEQAERMLEDASAEIAGLVDIHGLIDDVAGDDRRLGFQ